MSIQAYFQPVKESQVGNSESYRPDQLGACIERDISKVEDCDLVIFNVEEERGGIGNDGCSKGADEVRKYLYQLTQGDYNIKVADVGTIMPGDSITDTYFALKESISFFLKKQIVPVFLGGSQDLVYGNYLAYTAQEQAANLVSIDARFGLGEATEEINSLNYFSKILLHQPNVLFNYSNLAYQTYFVGKDELNLLDELYFDRHRLGELKEDIRVAEPIIRNADFINFSMSAIGQPYAGANKMASPNGLNGEQACQLSRYAGMSDKLSSFGIYDFNPTVFDHGQSAHLIAQMLWYFIDGFYNRKGDFPACNKKEYIKYTVAVEEGEREIVFYKSPKSDRWWMDVPYHASFYKKYERHLMLPCNYEDYLTATENEIPERWFQTFKKLK